MEKVKTVMSPSSLSKIAEVVKTIGHPQRIEIIEVLRTFPSLTVLDIQDKMRTNIEQSLLSHHLIKMKDKGILVSRKEGSSVFYSLRVKDMLRLLECLENCSCHFA
ncbi:MAG: winged helix-turn-helix transcriptional regulator [Saprospiraceae bacterium]|nr:winged helix-turn-helix transcriptional regulator [Saprospiraceae bacterium]